MKRIEGWNDKPAEIPQQTWERIRSVYNKKAGQVSIAMKNDIGIQILLTFGLVNFVVFNQVGFCIMSSFLNAVASLVRPSITHKNFGVSGGSAGHS